MGEGEGVVMGEEKGPGGAYLEKSFLDLGVGDQLVAPHVLDEVPVGPAGAAPGHVDEGAAEDGGGGVECWSGDEAGGGDAAETCEREASQDQREKQLSVRQCRSVTAAMLRNEVRDAVAG